MWKYISGVPKVVEEKKKEKNLKAACDSKGSKEYEKNRSRKFSAKWQVGRPWLQHDQDKGMICKWYDMQGYDMQVVHRRCNCNSWAISTTVSRT